MEGTAIIAALAAALIGAGLAYINYRLTAYAAGKQSTTTLSLMPVVRMLLSVGYLAALFLLGQATSLDTVWLLAGGAAGLTLPSFAFTFLLLKKLPGKNGTAAGEHHDPKGGNE